MYGGGNYGGSGGGAWQGQGQGGGYGGMDKNSLVNTLVNVATNILSGAGQGMSGGQQGGMTPRGSPWVGQQQQQSRAGGMMGGGQGIGRVQLEQQKQRVAQAGGFRGETALGGQGAGGYGGHGAGAGGYGGQGDGGYGGQNMGGYGRQNGGAGGYGGQGARVRGNELKYATNPTLEGKNYRPKIKEEGQPPNYHLMEYMGINPSMFWCKPCGKKPMWDAESFLKHIIGQTHNKKIEEAIQEEKDVVAEVRNRLKEMAGKVEGESQGCKMCSIKVKGGKDAMNHHRASEGHQALKKFIHPHCDICDADFESRAEWNYHRFSAEHLSNMTPGGKSNVMPTQDLKKLCKRLGGATQEPAKKDNNNQKKQTNGKQSHSSYEDVVILDDDGEENEGVKAVLKDVDLHNKDIPGSEFVTPVNGFFCKLCKQFFGPGKEVVKQHCGTDHHMALQMAQTKAGGKRAGEAKAGPKAKKTK